MTPRGGRLRPAFDVRDLAKALGLALALAAPLLAPASAFPQAPRRNRVPTLYHKSRSFRIPFNVEPADRPRLKEVQLWVSEDSGFTWKAVSRTTPDRPAFNFRAGRDAEFWFAVRTLDVKGQLFPGEDEKVEPSMKVIVDTTPPSLVLDQDGRRGSLASVRWEVRDEHLDLKSLVVEYQAEGARNWRQVPIRRPSLIGSESWDAGTAEALRVRASVADRAGNVAEANLTLAEGTPVNPAVANNNGDAAEYTAPPISPISSGPTFPPQDDPFAPRNPGVGAPPGDPFPPTSPGATTPAGPPPVAPPAFVPGNDPFGGTGTGPAPEPAPAAAQTPAAPAPASPKPAPPDAGAAASQLLLVSSPKFPLLYEVDDAGPGGPASVQLWVTQDGGRTWFPKGEDPNRTSPFPVDLGGEGTFGLRVVATGASGLGDAPPAPGDPPHLWVAVDRTPPTVTLTPTAVGHGQDLGRVAIRWKATDVHLGPNPVTLSWRPADQPGAPWQKISEQPLENNGLYFWTVPESVPPRFHVRVDVVDTAGNHGSAESSAGPPVLVDRARPRTRIIGLDPSARSGPNAMPFR